MSVSRTHCEAGSLVSDRCCVVIRNWFLPGFRSPSSPRPHLSGSGALSEHHVLSCRVEREGRSQSHTTPQFPSLWPELSHMSTQLCSGQPLADARVPQAHKPAAPGGGPEGLRGSRALLFASAATSWTVCLALQLQSLRTWLLELPGTSDASRQVHLFVIYTIVPRTPFVTLNPLSDVIEIF